MRHNNKKAYHKQQNLSHVSFKDMTNSIMTLHDVLQGNMPHNNR